MVYFILFIYLIVGYKYVEGKYSVGSHIATYDTLAQAILACNGNDRCGTVVDGGCNDNDWETWSGRSVSKSSYGSCAWIKPFDGGF